MRVAELLKISSETMKTLSKFGIRMGDYKYLDMFSEYEELVGRGYKSTCAVAELAAVHNVSGATVYRIIKKFKTTV